MADPTSEISSSSRPSKIPRRPERITQPISPIPAQETGTATSVSPSRIPRRLEHAAQLSAPSITTPKTTTQPRLLKLPRRAERTDQPIAPTPTLKVIEETSSSKKTHSHDGYEQGLQPSSEVDTPGPTMNNDNSNMNVVSGSVHTLINNNTITNIYGLVPRESNANQVKIAADLKPRYVPQALYDAQLGSGCMEGTRVKILNDIIEWIKGPNAQKIFWLTGWAGTGKSAIAWTICSRATNEPGIVLGGSFFFSRSASSAAQRDVRCVIPTLAQILARQSDLFSQALADELARDPDVLHKQISVQVEKLLSKPLRAHSNSLVPVLFVIDALDECGGQSTGDGNLDDSSTHRIVSEMLDALVTLCTTEVDLPVRFLVTSRPETHIRDTPVSDHELSKVLRLQSVDKEQVTADIRLYIVAKLLSTPRLRTRFSASDADMLAQLCDGLFIVATTALKYTFERGNDTAPMRFKKLLNASRDGLSTGAAAPLDRMYTLILEDAARVEEPEGGGLAAMLQLLAVLLSTRMTLSVMALADLLDRPSDDTRAVLSLLHAVVHVPEDDHEPGLRTLHASFGDYISSRAPSHVRVSHSDSHDTSARAAVRVMEERLHFNISQSHSSYELNAPMTPSGITLSLQYACTQWVYHVASLPDPSALDTMISTIFCPRFLFWLEVMSVLGQVQRAAAMLHFIGVTVRTPELSRFFRHANSFVASSREAIERSAPHIYLSALPFANKSDTIYQTFYPSCAGLATIDVLGIGPHGGRLVMTLKGHEDSVNSLSYSEDGLFIASGSEDGTVRVWDTRSGEATLDPLRSGNGKVTAVVFAPSGKSVVSGTETGTVCIWNILAGQSTMQQLFGHSESVVSVAVSSDSRIIASASCDRTVRVWRIGTGQLLTVLTGHDDPSKGVAVSPNGQVTTSGSYNFTNIESHKIDLTDRPNFRVSETKQFMVWIKGQSICLWTQQNQDKPSLICLDGHTAAVRSAVISPDSSYVASASDDGTIRIWDVAGGNESVQSISAVLPLSNAPVLQAVSRQGANIVSVWDDGSITLWDMKTSETRLLPLAEHTLDITTLAISSAGNLITTGFTDGTVRLWNAQTGQAIGEPLPGGQSRAMKLILTPNARWLVSLAKISSYNFFASSEYEMRIWDAEGCRETHHIPLPAAFTKGFGQWLVGVLSFDDSLPGELVDISADGRLLAAGDTAGDIMLWQIESDLKTLEPLRTAVAACSIRFSPDGTHIVSGGSNNIGRIWNIATGQLVFELAGHADTVTRVTYSPDGQLIATSSADKTVRIWDTKTGQSVVTLHEHQEYVDFLEFADGGSLISGSRDGNITAWNADAVHSLFPEGALSDFRSVSVHDGWLTGPSGELLLWVPAEYRTFLHMPPYIQRVHDKRVVVKTSSDGWHRGQDWTSCWPGQWRVKCHF